MPSRYDILVSLFRLIDDVKADAGRDQDLRRAPFTHHDVVDVILKDNVLSVALKDGRRWQGRPDELRWSEIQQLLAWSEVKAVEADLGLSGSRVYPRKKNALGGMDNSPRSLRKVLKEIRQWRRGIQLWELEPEALIYSQFKEIAESDVVAHWDIDSLSEAVENDYEKMSQEERKDFDRLGYMWGYTKDGSVSVTAMRPEEGAVVQFLQVRGTPIKRLK